MNECATFSPSLHNSWGPFSSCFILRFAHSYDSLVHMSKEFLRCLLDKVEAFMLSLEGKNRIFSFLKLFKTFQRHGL